MRNVGVISQAPGIAYPNQISPPQIYTHLQSYPSFESSNSGFVQYRNNLPCPYLSKVNELTPANQINPQVSVTNNRNFDSSFNYNNINAPIQIANEENNGVESIYPVIPHPTKV
jgi:hypothetical protein